MANSKKYHYYVMVMTNEGPKYVTGIGDHHTAYWNEEKKPMEFSSASYAEDVYVGLCMNFFTAVLVKSRFEIDHHPYNYADYDLKFEKKDKEEAE